MVSQKPKIETHSDLNAYFYSKLEELNLINLEKEYIFYSSDILSRYATYPSIDSDSLGLEFLEGHAFAGEGDKNKIYQSVAERALLLSSYFEKSLDKKIVNSEYYVDLGKSAYQSLNKCRGSYFDVPNFFSVFAQYFEVISAMIKKLTIDFKTSINDQYSLDLRKQGIIKKAS